jgi:hydroxyquinol 1,2-dioxygenase
MRNLDQHNVTDAVVTRFGDTPDPRVREIVISLVRHLHAFARDVELTEEEWQRGIEFLTATGHACDDRRQEFILLSDVLGVSMLTIAMGNERPAGCTESTVLGPFYVDDAPEYALGTDIANGAPGEPCEVTGSVLALDGTPIPGALLNVWQADADGLYDVQRRGLDAARARGALRTDANGKFRFRTVLPCSYPVPTDGPVGELLNATKRHAWRPAHLHFMIEARSYDTLITHVFRSDDPYLESDAVFAVRESLIADWARRSDGVWTLEYDFTLNPSGRA